MRKVCKRKIYHRINPIAYVLEGIKPADSDRLSKLRTAELSAIEAFAKGQATRDDWESLADMANVAGHMAQRGIGVEVNDVVEEVHQHLTSAAKRWEKTGKMGLTGEGLKAIRDLYEYHDLQRTSITLADYEKHLRKVVNLIRGRHPSVQKAL